jgi:hypothetical protein
MQDSALTAQTERDVAHDCDVVFSRAAYETFLKLDPALRRLVHLAALADAQREVAPGIFSSDAGPDIRVVFTRGDRLASVLALTGGRAA